jgi:phosphohistidine phosphatase
VILYVVRHAIALPHGTPGVAEDDRPLSKEGIRKMEAASAGMKAIDCRPDLICTSPLPRAKATAEIVRDTLGEDIQIELVEALSPKGARAALYKELSARRADRLMIVGHQPSLGDLAGEIAWGSAERFVELKKGGMCAIELDSWTPAPRGKLVWLLTPSILRTLG